MLVLIEGAHVWVSPYLQIIERARNVQSMATTIAIPNGWSLGTEWGPVTVCGSTANGTDRRNK
eukprot:6177219-Pleurochrysis_carterae.AAC.1